MTRKKRRYVRLSPSTWTEICGLWEVGDVTLPELAERYSVNTRTLQAQFAKRKIIKGSKAAELAAVVMKEVLKGELGDQDKITHRAVETREAGYVNATIVEGLVMAQLALAQKDPTQAYKAITAMRMLSLAAGTLERLRALKWCALGLDKENALRDVMPELIIRDLSKEELKALAERDESDEESDLGIPIAPTSTESGFAGTDESDDIIVEGDEIIVEDDEAEEAAKPSPATLCPLGGRLVREHTP
jgi:hypothetical protein